VNNKQLNTNIVNKNLFILSNNNRSKIIAKEIGIEALNYIDKYVDIRNPYTYIVSDDNRFNEIDSLNNKYKAVIELNQLNKKIGTNEYFKRINKKLDRNGTFIARFKIKANSNKKLSVKIISTNIKSNILVNSIDRITKLKFCGAKNKNIPLFASNKNKTKMNLYGRLYYFGFEIVAEKEIGIYNYFIAKKVNTPSLEPFPSASPIIKLNRVGKDGKIIAIYKFRTMYPFSEYLQGYVFKNNNLDDGGKFKDDSRISRVGSIMRRYWIDEIPMLINLLKGDIKFFGVRPLSLQYYNLYSDELKQLRIKFKPGLIPPYYVDLPKSFEEILTSEKKYLQEYQKKPYITDFKYLIKAFYNILIKCKRSK